MYKTGITCYESFGCVRESRVLTNESIRSSSSKQDDSVITAFVTNVQSPRHLLTLDLTGSSRTLF